ncbi:MAG TPA: glycosyltransferase [Candidatus Binataceae bacterium]|nr:glycosyltransferase [Candidatus Binataceae bacterium]
MNRLRVEVTLLHGRMLAEMTFYAAAGLLVYTYLLYPLVLALLPRAHDDRSGSPPPLEAGPQWPRISVIVAAHDEANTIARKVQNFFDSTYPGESELLIVSDGSTDATASIVDGLASERVRLLTQPRQGKGAALNLAVPQARGEILVFTDATSMFAPQTMTELVRPFADPRVGLVNGRIRYHQAEVANLYHRYEQMLKLLEARGGLIATAHGAIYALRRELWCSRDPRLVNDFFDPIFVNLKGAAVALAPRALCFEEFAVKTQFKRQVRMVALAALVYFTVLPDLLHAHLWRSVIVLTSHKLFRWLTAVWLSLLVATTPGLAAGGGIYRVALVGEILIAALAALGPIASRLGWSERATVFYRFLSLNLAAAIGLWLWLRGRVPVTWEPSGL